MAQDEVRAAARALSIEYAIRDVVVPPRPSKRKAMRSSN